MVSTIVERCQGCAPTSHPRIGPEAMIATTIRVSSRPAVAGERPSPRTKKG